MTSSFTARVRLGAALSSVVAALLAAIGTSLVASLLLERVVERRLSEAALVLARELDEEDFDDDLEALVADELSEMAGTGIVFAIFDAAALTRLAGDARLQFPRGGQCEVAAPLLLCASHSNRGQWVVSAESHDRTVGPFLWATGLAAAAAGLFSWFASKVIARWLTAPLTALRERLADVDVGSGRADLGGPSNVVEVDELRAALSTLMSRVDDAIRTAERFAADAAHELRTPLTAIRGELELAIEAPASAKVELGRIRDKSVELQALVERILLLALPEARAQAVAELVALDELAADVVAELGAAARVTIVAPPAPAVVRGDSVLLAAALNNAISNALKFGTNATVDVRSDQQHIVAIISDDGPGVRLEMREAVFQPFVRDAAHARVPGRGLGLAIIANIMRRHAGSARFLDADHGARLELRFPAASAVPQAALPKRA